MLIIPPRPRQLALLTVLYGVILFIWMSAEDSVWLVSLFGLGLSLLIAAHSLFRLAGRDFPARIWTPGAVMGGALVGMGANLATMLLMVIKTAWHAHMYPDYPFPLIAGIATRLPAWGLAGALVGLAFVIVWGYRRE
ncbi:MAG: hypothetical protein IT324_33390 [Anaerolineae bacterium]|nr:hypothetical protein [Anaerolineae bacterium]